MCILKVSCTLLFTVNAILSLGLVTDGEFNSLRTQGEPDHYTFGS